MKDNNSPITRITWFSIIASDHWDCFLKSRAQTEQQEPRITEKGSDATSVRPAAPQKLSNSQSDVVEIVKSQDTATSGCFKLPGQSTVSTVRFLVPLFRCCHRSFSLRYSGTI